MPCESIEPITEALSNIGIIGVVIGLCLIIHHTFAYGKLFDTTDWIGHDWLGLGLAIGSLIWMVYWHWVARH